MQRTQSHANQLTWQMKSKTKTKTKKKAHARKKHQFVTHAEKVGGSVRPEPTNEVVVKEKELVSDVVDTTASVAVFTAGRIGVCIPRHITLKRQKLRFRFSQRDGYLLDADREDEQTLSDMLWVPHHCETLIIGKAIELRHGMMTHLTQVQRIEFEYFYPMPTPSSENAQFYPPNLRSLIIRGTIFDVDLPISFPQTLTEIVLPFWIHPGGEQYAEDPNFITWPKRLTRLDYPDHRHPVQEWNLSDTVTDLSLGGHFNLSVSGWTPPRNLTRLVFRREFQQNLAEIAWHSSSVGLIELELGENWEQPLFDQKLPQSLKRLSLLANAEYQVNEFILPPQLEELILSGEWRGDLKQVKLPSTLTRLQFLGNANQSLKGLTFPPSLTELLFSDMFCDNPVEGNHLVLNEGLKHLNFGQQFDEPVASLRLPSTLQSLIFGMRFNRDVFSLRLPAGLRTLVFGERFSRSLRGFTLPSSLTHLTLGSKYNQTLRGVVLPPALREFHLPSHVFDSLRATFPKSITLKLWCEPYH